MGVKISGLPTANPISGSELVAIVQDSETRKTAASSLVVGYALDDLSNLSDASAARTNLGLGTICTQDSSSVSLTGGTIDNVSIGSSTANAGTFTSLASDDITVATTALVANSSSVTINTPLSVETVTLHEQTSVTTPATDHHTLFVDSTGALKLKTDSGSTITYSIVGHTHDASDIVSGTINSARLPAIDAVTLNGKSDTDFALVSHTHDASDIVSGTLDSSRLPVVSTTQAGIAPASGNASLFLKGDGTWASPPSAGNFTDLSDGPGVITANQFVAGNGAGTALVFVALATVATSGSYNDLSDLPSLVTIDDTNTFTTKTWSSDKINTELAGKANSVHTHSAGDITSGTLGAARLPVFVGDSGSGGTQGAVPAPGVGDATKFLKGDGTWTTIPTGSTVVDFTDLGDVPGSYTGTSGKILYSTGSALEFRDNVDITDSGLAAWSGTGNYWSRSGSTFSLLRGGYGFIQGANIPFVAQDITLTPYVMQLIAIDSSGTLVALTDQSYTTYKDHITLFEVYYDNVSDLAIITREDHSYRTDLDVRHFEEYAVGVTPINVALPIGLGGDGLVWYPVDADFIIWDVDITSDFNITGFDPVNQFFCYFDGTHWRIHSYGATFPLYSNESGTLTALTDGDTLPTTTCITKDDLNSPDNPVVVTLIGPKVDGLKPENYLLNTPDITAPLSVLQLRRYMINSLTQVSGVGDLEVKFLPGTIFSEAPIRADASGDDFKLIQFDLTLADTVGSSNDTDLMCVQPTGVTAKAITVANFTSPFMKKSNNLSDVANTATALSNLGGVPNTRTVTGVDGLGGGGALSGDQTLHLEFLNLTQSTPRPSDWVTFAIDDTTDSYNKSLISDLPAPYNYLSGCSIAYNSTTAITVNIGDCMDSTNTRMMHLSSSKAPSLSTTGVNALDIGTKANSTWYAVFVISDGSNVNTLFSTSATSPVLPAGYLFFRRVAWIYVNGSGNIEQFHQYNRRFRHYNVQWDVNGVSVTNTSQNFYTLMCPPGGLPIELLMYSSAAGTQLINFASHTAEQKLSVYSAASGNPYRFAYSVFIYTNQGIYVQYNAVSSSVLYLKTQYWEDWAGMY